MIQSGGFLGRLLGPLLKTGLPLIKNANAAALAADAEIHKKILGSGNLPLHNRVLTISNDEIEDIIKIAKYLEDSGLLKRVTETVQNKVKEQKGGFLSMLLGTLGAILLGNILTGQGINRAGKGKGINRAGEGIVRVGYGNNNNNNNKNNMDF